MNLLLTGATGFIGTAFIRAAVRELAEIRVLARDPEKARKRLSPLFAGTKCKLSVFGWSPDREVAPATAFEGVDAVMHLAGENVGAGRWSTETKRRIFSSRQVGTRNLVAAINQMARAPIFISASAVGYYGDRGDEVLTEDSTSGKGFLTEVCITWETEARLAHVSRLVQPRFGIVLGREGGALEKIIPLFKSGLGGRLGDGKQWVSWIHIDDAVGILLHFLKNPVTGTYNVTAPNPVTNTDFTHAIGTALHRPTVFAVPEFALKLALGEMAEQTLLSSQRVSGDKVQASGYRFRYPTIDTALDAIVGS